MLFLTISLLCATSALAVVPLTLKPIYSLEDQDLEQLFQKYVDTHAKQYGDAEERKRRLTIFKQNVAEINRKNADSTETAVFVAIATAPFNHWSIFGPMIEWLFLGAITMGGGLGCKWRHFDSRRLSDNRQQGDINKFTDFTKEEFINMYTGFRPLPLRDDIPYTYVNELEFFIEPDSFDWRTKHAVSEVKIQGRCASSWAFSATGAVEGAYGAKHGKNISLSESQLIDCALSEYDCSGGLMQPAIQYLVNISGQMNETDYPYVPKLQSCKFNKTKVQVQVESVLNYNLKGEKDTKQLLVRNGPIAIGIDPDDIEFYQNGILKSCSSENIYHGVLLVGYGQENGQKYYIIKNSWGTAFGEKGYMRVEITDNPCGMYNGYAAGATVA